MITRIFMLTFVSLLTLQLSAQINDEFDDAAFSAATWDVFQSGNTLYYQSLEVDDVSLEGSPIAAAAGQLTFLPGLSYWYASTTGPLLYQSITGDFDVYAQVNARDRDDLSQPPDGSYNSVGLLCRNPDVSSGQNYVMVNLGRQAGTLASESKNTFNSSSTLFLRADVAEGLVRLQRVGDTIRTYKQTAADADWVLLDQFLRPDFPSTMQVGVCGNGYIPLADLWAEVDYVRWMGNSCDMPMGLTASIGVSGIDLSWTAVAGADAYQVQGRPLGTSAWAKLNVFATSVSIPNALVSCETSYEWRIRARCPAAATQISPFSANDNFTSSDCAD